MPETRPPIDLRGLDFAELQRLIGERRLPPVDQWDPPHCGHSEMRIARDGSWFHQGRPIRRPAMIRLFSTVLRREGPERSIALRLDSGDVVLLGPANPLTLAPTPRVQVRHGLEAELSRPVYYELAELALAEGGAGIWSNGAFFPLDDAQ